MNIEKIYRKMKANDGWVAKKALLENISENRGDISLAAAYTWFRKDQDLFEQRKEGKTSFVRWIDEKIDTGKAQIIMVDSFKKKIALLEKENNNLRDRMELLMKRVNTPKIVTKQNYVFIAEDGTYFEMNEQLLNTLKDYWS
jgi:hypothetical protein